MARASFSSWVTSTVAMRWSAMRWQNSSRRLALRSASSAEKGSSSNSTRGWVMRARASATRCCSPPERWVVRPVAAPARPKRCSMSRACARACALPWPCSTSPKATLSCTLRCENSAKSWNISAKPAPLGRAIAQVHAIRKDAARVHRLQAGDDAQQGAFTAARGAQNGHPSRTAAPPVAHQVNRLRGGPEGGARFCAGNQFQAWGGCSVAGAGWDAGQRPVPVRRWEPLASLSCAPHSTSTNTSSASSINRQLGAKAASRLAAPGRPMRW